MLLCLQTIKNKVSVESFIHNILVIYIVRFQNTIARLDLICMDHQSVFRLTFLHRHKLLERYILQETVSSYQACAANLWLGW